MGKHEYGVDTFRFRGECRCGRVIHSFVERGQNPRGMYIRCRECEHISWATSEGTTQGVTGDGE